MSKSCYRNYCAEGRKAAPGLWCSWDSSAFTNVKFRC